MKRLSTTLLAVLLTCFSLANSFGQSCTGNLATNPGFENGLTGWTKIGTASTVSNAHSGAKALRIPGDNENSRVFQKFPVAAGQGYNLRFWGRRQGGAGGLVQVRFLNASNQPFGAFSVNIASNTWQEYTTPITVPANAVFLQINAKNTNDDDDALAFFDDFCLTPNAPDLQPLNLVVPATASTGGGPFFMSVDVQNNGTAPAVATSLTVYFNVTFVSATVSVPALQPGGQVSLTANCTTPPFAPPGTYSVVASVDMPGNTVAESNEGNNDLATQISLVNASVLTLTCPADLTVNATNNSGACGTTTTVPMPTATTTCPQGISILRYLGHTIVSGSPDIIDNFGGQCGDVLFGGSGTADITFGAQDVCGGVAFCTFRMTRNLLPPSSPIARMDDRQRLVFDKFYPNPTAYQTTMELYSPVEQAATLDFYDRTGRLLHTMEVQLEQGQNLIEQLVFDWKSGTYNVVVKGEKSGLPAYGRFLKVWEE